MHMRIPDITGVEREFDTVELYERLMANDVTLFGMKLDTILEFRKMALEAGCPFNPTPKEVRRAFAKTREDTE